jgi:hypothetical protein
LGGQLGAWLALTEASQTHKETTKCEEESHMAETNKLSVGKALEKLQGAEAPKSRMSRLDEKIDELERETRRMRAERLRIERDQQAAKKTR